MLLSAVLLTNCLQLREKGEMNFLVHSFCISVTGHLYNKTKVEKELWFVKHSRKLILIR